MIPTSTIMLWLKSVHQQFNTKQYHNLLVKIISTTEHSNEPSGSIEGRDCLYWLRAYKFLRKDSDSLSLLHDN
jgi:hypothetical protein